MQTFFDFPNPVNEVSARFVAGGVLVLGLATLVFRQPWIIVLLAIGFVLRAASGPRIEPLALLVTRVLVPRLSLPERPTAGPPKRFAQGIGAVVTITASILWFGFGLHGWALALIAMLVVFAGLESLAGLCVGCKIFALGIRAGIVPPSVCEDCNDLGLRARRLASLSE